MSFYILRRILYAIPIAFGVSVVCFSLVYIAPGDPLQTVMPPDATAETIEIVKKAYGFDKPLPMQFPDLARARADRRFRHGRSRPAARSFWKSPRRWRTRRCWHCSRCAHLIFTGYVMGAIAGCFPGRWIDRLVTGAAVFGVSLPNYWLGIVLVIFFAVEYMLLPATGMGPNGSTGFHILEWSSARFLVLPVITLSMDPGGHPVAQLPAQPSPRCITRIWCRPCAPRGFLNGR